jgi:NADH-quinone oxidoreductase subunit G
LLDVPDFDYDSSEAVRDELQNLDGRISENLATELEASAELTVKAADLDVPMYSVDALTRRAGSLQQTVDAATDWRKTA